MANPHDIFAVAAIKDSLIVGSVNSVGNLFTDHVHGILLHEVALSSTVRRLSYYWKKEERKRLRSTMIILLL